MLHKGLILKGIGGFYYVETDDGVFSCRAKGIFRKREIKPLPGDRVKIDIIDLEKMEGNVVEIEKRKNEFKRPEVANIDQAIIMISVKAPGPDLLLLDKLLITANKKDIKPIICLNKIDLDEENFEAEIIKEYEPTGLKIFNISAIEKVGIEKIKNALKGSISVLAGQSGVGKSTLLNAIMEENVMETGIVSEKNSRGKHTTRHAELVELKSGGYIIDTPGFSNFELDGIDYMFLKNHYPEFYEFEDECKYNTCIHISEPKCRVKEALLNKEIGQGRYNRYKTILETIKDIKKY